jgi:tRNA pseudouridine(55) synthase
MTDSQEKTIHLMYKKLGDTPFQCVDKFKKDNPFYRYIPMTYAGRLDPMAEGLLLVLSGSAINDKEKYLGLSKTYEFEVLWEFETDTQDILGLSKNDEISIFPTIDEIVNSLNNSIGVFEQKYPAYSSQTVNGKSLIEWSRLGRIHEVEIPSHQVEIMNIKHLSRRFISGDDLLKEIIHRIGLVNGDFRQEQIINRWKKVLSMKSDKLFTIDKIEVEASGGFYVRQFVTDMAQKLKTVATTFHIKRNKVGEYNLEMIK